MGQSLQKNWNMQYHRTHMNDRLFLEYSGNSEMMKPFETKPHLRDVFVTEQSFKPSRKKYLDETPRNSLSNFKQNIYAQSDSLSLQGLNLNDTTTSDHQVESNVQLNNTPSESFDETLLPSGYQESHLDNNQYDKMSNYDLLNNKSLNISQEGMEYSSMNGQIMEEGEYTLNFSQRSISDPSNLETYRKMHVGIKNYQCRSCKTCFKWSPNLVDREINHTGEKKYKCSFCDEMFGWSLSLNWHRLSHYNDIKDFQCCICSIVSAKHGTESQSLK